MRTTLIALAAATGLIGLGAAAAPIAPAPAQASAPDEPSAIVQADWSCGPRCQQWRHRSWEHRHHHWREQRYPYYGYNYNYGRNYPQYHYYR